MTNARSASPPRRRGIQILQRLLAGLFIGVFFAAAVFFANGLYSQLQGGWQARGWVAVEAQLLDWRTVQRSSGARTGAAGSTPSVPVTQLEAHYRWSYDGRTFEGRDVAFGFMADNFSGDWRRSVIRRLERARQGAPLQVWVNPRQPSQAVIERRLPTPQAIFAAVFLIFPCGFATFVAVALALSAAGMLLRLQLDPLVAPAWAILHGLPGPFIAVVADPADIGLWTGLFIVVLCALLLAGLVTLVRRVTRVSRRAG